MRGLPLNALRAFAAVYETGGVRPAARVLEITHSSVSRHVREREAWVGLALIEPREGNRTLRFTAQGEALGRAALESLRNLAGAVEALRERRRGNAVIITTTPSLAARWLLPRLHMLDESHPWIELSVIADQRLADPSEPNADIGIRMGHGPWPGFACSPLMDDTLYPVMSPGFWRDAGKPRSPADLVGLRLLHDRDPHASWDSWCAVHGPAGLDLRAGPRFASSDLVLRAAAQGLGVALARDRLVADDLAAGTLIRPLDGLDVTIADSYWIVTSGAAGERHAVVEVIGWLRRQAEAAPDYAAPKDRSLTDR